MNASDRVLLRTGLKSVGGGGIIVNREYEARSLPECGVEGKM